MTTATEAPRELNNAMIMVSVQFLPVTAWPELEQARQRHERALDEYRAARRDEARLESRHRAERTQEVAAAAGRILDAQDAVDPVEVEDRRRREVHAISVRLQAASLAAKTAVFEALRLVEDHPQWAAEIAARRAAAGAEHDELLAGAAEAAERARSENHLERWLVQAATANSPQPYRDAGPPPPPPATIAGIFGDAA